jgi:hypothetical protein
MADLTFRHLQLYDAEAQLVGACIRREAALRLCLETLPENAFRSESGADFRMIFLALAGWLDRGTYNPETNEKRLTAGMAAIHAGDPAYDDPRWWQAFLDDLWTPWTASGVYFTGLLDAVISYYRLQDAETKALDALLHHSPLQLSDFWSDWSWLSLRDAIARARLPRSAMQSAPPPADKPPPRGTLDVFNR